MIQTRRPDLSITMGEGWAVIEDNGDRTYMEDRFVAAESIGTGVLLFGVFDGHNGSALSEYCKTHVAAHIRTELADKRHRSYPKPVEHALSAAMESMDKAGSMDTALPASKDVGSTACLVLLTINNAWFVNVGDSRGIIKTRGQVQQMTVDHKPMVKSESDRVRKHGGYLSNTDGSWRINGRLNLSRSIGDWTMRPFIVPTPTVSHHHRPDHTSTCGLADCNEYIVIASDGLFDVMQNEDITRIVDAQPHTRDGLASALKTLVLESRMRGSSDNITIMYVGLSVTKTREADAYT